MKFNLDRSLLPLKLVLFTYYGAAACILPYLTVHMRQIGITVEETAIIYAVLPIVGFLGPPVAGFLADRLGRYQPVLIVSLVAVAVFHTALLAIPHVSFADVPAHVEFACNDLGAIVQVERCSEELPCPLAFPSARLRFGLDRCFSDCFPFNNDSRTNCLTFRGVGANASEDDSCMDIANSTVLVFSDTRLVDPDSRVCRYEINRFCFDAMNCSFATLICPNSDFVINGSSPLSSVEGSGDQLPVCAKFVGNHLLTFSTYFLLRIIGGVFLSITFTLMDATCFALIGECKGEYGKQKLWSTLATAIFSPITGFLIDYVSTQTKGYADYSPAFYVFDGLIVCTVLLSFRLSVQLDNSSEKMIENLKQLLRKIEVVAFLIMIFFLGSMWGFLETFLFWYMLDLESPKYLLGLTVTIGSGVSIPVLFWAGKILKRTGNIPLLICAFGFYAIRMVGYSFIYNPWWSLMFESLEVITINLMWVAAATYGNSIAPQGLTATMQGTMGGIHYGIGRGAGSFVGGLLMQNFGVRMTFRIMGVTSLISCFCTLAYYVNYFRRPKPEHRRKSITNGIGLKNREDSQLQRMLRLEETDAENGTREFEMK